MSPALYDAGTIPGALPGTRTAIYATVATTLRSRGTRSSSPLAHRPDTRDDEAPSAYVLPDATAQLHPDRDEVRAMLDLPDVQLLDVRSREEFAGERFWPSGATAGAERYELRQL